MPQHPEPTRISLRRRRFVVVLAALLGACARSPREGTSATVPVSQHSPGSPPALAPTDVHPEPPPPAAGPGSRIATPTASDGDGDGLDDAVDQCPGEPETHNGYEDRDGCPDEIPSNVTQCYPSSPYYVHFASAGPGRLTPDGLGRASALDPTGRATLDKTIPIFAEFPAVRVEISGHTDSREGRTSDERRAISLARAASIRDDLMKRHGIAGWRLDVRGAADAEPIATNESAEGRALNRRTEFIVAR